MREAWEKGWKCLLDSLDQLKPADLPAVISSATRGKRFWTAVQRSWPHYPHHCGQIIFQAKILKGMPSSRCHPKGNSAKFNRREKFNQKKEIRILPTELIWKFDPDH